MPATVRRAVTALSIAAGAATLASAAPAAAAVAVTPNVCQYATDGFWRDLDLRVAATASPVYVPPGASFRLTGTAVAARFPDWIAEYGFNLGLLDGSPAGVRNVVPAEAWVAIAGRGSAQGAQVVRATVNAETTITTSADGQQFRSATPLQVTVPFDDTTWTAPTAAGSSVTFEQADPGSLPTIPARAGAAATTPQGSVFVRAALTNQTVFDLDCRPGRASADQESFAVQAASPFERAYVDPSAAATGVATPPLASPALALRSSALRTDAARATVPVAVRNTGGTTATGQVKLTTVARQRLRRGGPKRRIVAVDWVDYSVPAGARRTLRLKLSKDLRTVLRSKRLVKVEVALRADAGAKTAAGLPRYQRAVRVTLPLRRR